MKEVAKTEPDNPEKKSGYYEKWWWGFSVGILKFNFVVLWRFWEGLGREKTIQMLIIE